MRIPKLIPALLAVFAVANAGASAWAGVEPSSSSAHPQLLRQVSNWEYGYNSRPHEYGGGSYYYQRDYYGSNYSYGNDNYYEGDDNNDCDD
jgi:hypothetical protein